MADQQIAVEILQAHSRGSEDLAGSFGSLAGLLEQARVSDDCFGPIGELLAFKYFEGLQECQDLATQAQHFLEETSHKVITAAKMYGDADVAAETTMKKTGEGLDKVGAGPGTLNDVNHAGDANRKGYLNQYGSYGSSAWSTVSDAKEAARTQSPPDVAISAVNSRMEALQSVMNPGKAFIENGLGFLISIVISPLIEFIIEPAIGDPAQMRSTAEGWDKVADWVEKAGQREQERADGTKDGWAGNAGDAFRAQMTEFGEGAQAFANDIRGVKQILEMAADLFDMFVEIVVDIIQELVISLIIEWLAALAMSWCTAGASVIAAEATTGVTVARTGGKLTWEVKKLLGRLKPMIDRLEKLLKQLRNGPLKKVMERTEKMRDGSWLEKKLVKQFDKSPIGRIATKGHTDEAARKSVDALNDAAARHAREGTDETAEALRKARVRLAEAGDSRTGNRFADGRDLSPGSDSLGVSLFEQGIKTVTGVSGSRTFGDAALKATMGVVPGEAVEQGVKYGYSKAEDPSTEDERREATDRGFTYE
ncbi:Proteins of 100 residues with WXG [Amycolatopsis xylanica]|uniref:Proteins of 100 residues with WXG n=1 Tax=Amycolatopsis xylanica TaxID=589385 RepID=A0A1H3L755_9PSEU|nr:WXG100 family type VII secretion target [Amycolatopsis xylanica]SDY60039.1 Proteins of 100 residues with WXG [Amycolatopsis xylanica]